jgi:predicted DNA-binding protein YlxM (UPF0122 family)
MSVRDKKIAQAVELYQEGKNTAEIGRALGVRHTTIRLWLQEAGIYKAVFLTGEQIDDIRMYYCSDRLSCKEIAEKMNLPEKRIKNALISHGIRRRVLTDEEKEKLKHQFELEAEIFARKKLNKIEDPIFYLPRKPKETKVTYHGKRYKDVSDYYLGG